MKPKDHQPLSREEIANRINHPQVLDVIVRFGHTMAQEAAAEAKRQPRPGRIKHVLRDERGLITSLIEESVNLVEDGKP